MSRSFKRIGLAAAAVMALTAGQAFAQAKKTPAQKPADPAPAQAAPAGQPPQDNRVELKPSQPQWTKVCGKDEQANKEICYNDPRLWHRSERRSRAGAGRL